VSSSLLGTEEVVTNELCVSYALYVHRDETLKVISIN
jgi:hypothetical protein